MPPRKRDCLKEDFSDFGVGTPSLFKLVLLPKLLIRKKFLILCGKSFEPLVCREELDMPEKLRFSEATVEVCDREPKSCVMFGRGVSPRSSLNECCTGQEGHQRSR